MNARASVIIPVYNGEKYIRSAIRSALKQSYKDIEIIVVDDASTDRTPEIVLEEFGSLVIYHRNEVNRERSFSRNKGFDISSGKYIFFLDADDEWEDDYIKESIDVLERYDVAYSFPRTFIDHTGRIIRRSKKTLPKDLGELIFCGLVGYPSATAFRRESFLKYREDMVMREDWELFIRAFLEGMRIKVLDNDTVRIREHTRRTSRNYEFYRATKKVFLEYRDKIPPAYYPCFVFHFSETAMRFGNAGEGWKMLIPLLVKHPRIIANPRRLLSILKRGWRFKII